MGVAARDFHRGHFQARHPDLNSLIQAFSSLDGTRWRVMVACARACPVPSVFNEQLQRWPRRFPSIN